MAVSVATARSEACCRPQRCSADERSAWLRSELRTKREAPVVGLCLPLFAHRRRPFNLVIEGTHSPCVDVISLLPHLARPKRALERLTLLGEIEKLLSTCEGTVRSV